ncbi:hypothetical protein KCU68_g83, partial [Aureobasidium melanogenum]
MGQYDRKAQSQRKHGPILSSSTSKAPARLPPSAKPEWRGSGYTRKAKPKPHLDVAKPVPVAQDQHLPLELQQLVLNVFKDVFAELMDFEELKGVLREVVEEVGEGKWESAFGEESKREAYVVRWSPSRALAYANVLAWFCEQRPEEDWVRRITDPSLSSKAKAICFGGGAAEMMAFAGLLRHLQPNASGRQQQELDDLTIEATPENTTPILEITLIDSADWSSVLDKLVKGTTTPPPLSKYASASARAANTALLTPQKLTINFENHDIFNLKPAQLKEILGTEEPVLATFFLTLGHLYTTSIPKTTAFLYKLDAILPVGSTILVVDSIGASVSVPVPDSEEVTEYSVSWLLSRVLLGKAAEPVQTQGKGKKAVEEDEANKPVPKWEKVINEEMKLHRLDEKLRYPGSLENVRFQILAFRRTCVLDVCYSVFSRSGIRNWTSKCTWCFWRTQWGSVPTGADATLLIEQKKGLRSSQPNGARFTSVICDMRMLQVCKQSPQGGEGTLPTRPSRRVPDAKSGDEPPSLRRNAGVEVRLDDRLISAEGSSLCQSYVRGTNGMWHFKKLSNENLWPPFLNRKIHISMPKMLWRSLFCPFLFEHVINHSGESCTLCHCLQTSVSTLRWKSRDRSVMCSRVRGLHSLDNWMSTKTYLSHGRRFTQTNSVKAQMYPVTIEPGICGDSLEPLLLFVPAFVSKQATLEFEQGSTESPGNTVMRSRGALRSIRSSPCVVRRQRNAYPRKDKQATVQTWLVAKAG